MAKPLYSYDFTIELTGTGETEEIAYDVAVGAFIEAVGAAETPPYTKVTREATPVVDTVYLECGICAREEEVRVDDFGAWAPEVYLSGADLGACCPDCQLRYCEQSADGWLEVVLQKVDFTTFTCSNLKRFIMNLINSTVGGKMSAQKIAN